MKHILFDLKDCPSELLDNEEHIRMSLYVAAKVSNSELININKSYIFISLRDIDY